MKQPNLSTFECRNPSCKTHFKSHAPTSFCSSGCFSAAQRTPECMNFDNRVINGKSPNRTQNKKRKGADVSNGANRRRYSIGDVVHCMNPECNKRFKVNSENHRYHSTPCRLKHQQELKKEQRQ